MPVGVASFRHLLERVSNTLCIENVGRAGQSERFGGERVSSRRFCRGKKLLPVTDRERRACRYHRRV